MNNINRQPEDGEMDEEAQKRAEEEVNATDDLHEIQVDDDLNEPDPEDESLAETPQSLSERSAGESEDQAQSQ